MIWVEALKAATALVVAVATLIGAIRGVQWARSKSPSLAPVHAVYRGLYATMRETGAHRIVLLRARNGGGLPSADCPIYSTALYDAAEDPIPTIIGQWDGVRVDDDYREVIDEALKQREFVLERSSLAEGSALRDLYESHSVRASWVAEVHRGDAAYYYLSANYSDGQPTPEDRNRLRACVTQLGRLLTDHLQVLDPA